MVMSVSVLGPPLREAALPSCSSSVTVSPVFFSYEGLDSCVGKRDSVGQNGNKPEENELDFD